MKKTLITLILVTLSSCFNGISYDEEWHNWRAKEDHNSFKRLGSIDPGKTLITDGIGMFLMFFEANCWYDIKVHGDHVNKAGGVNTSLYTRSRIGWRPNEKKGFIDVFAYINNNSKDKPIIIYLGTVEVWEEFECITNMVDGTLLAGVLLENESHADKTEHMGKGIKKIYRGSSITVEVDKDQPEESNEVGSRTFPYYGGDNVSAPWAMNIWMYWYH